MRGIRRGVGVALLLGLAAWALSCGGVNEEVAATVATLRPIRGSTQLGEDRAAPVARAAPDAELSVAEAGLARLHLDGGPSLLLDGGVGLTVQDEASVTLTAGRLFAEVVQGDSLLLTVEQGSLRATDASFSAALADGALRLYVVRGEVSYASGEPEQGYRGVVRPGEQLVLGGGEPEHTPATLWRDWTGGLARPRAPRR